MTPYSTEELKSIIENSLESLQAINVPFVFAAYFEEEPTLKTGGEMREQECLFDAISEKIIEDSITSHSEKDKEIAYLRKQIAE